MVAVLWWAQHGPGVVASPCWTPETNVTLCVSPVLQLKKSDKNFSRKELGSRLRIQWDFVVFVVLTKVSFPLQLTRYYCFNAQFLFKL